MPHTAFDIFPRVEHIDNAPLLGRLGHQLHQTFGTLMGNGIGVESRFGPDDGLNQGGVDAILLGRFLDHMIISIWIDGRGYRIPLLPNVESIPGVPRAIGKVIIPILVDIPIYPSIRREIDARERDDDGKQHDPDKERIRVTTKNLFVSVPIHSSCYVF